jgi:bifunctional ADP-heptose synthase (sugar kinase/adenylyltransferase)
MTQEQLKAIETRKASFTENVTEYSGFGSLEVCSFSVYQSEDKSDDNITIITNTITRIGDDYQPHTKITNILVEPNGSEINLMDFYPSKEALEYIKKLKKII